MQNSSFEVIVMDKIEGLYYACFDLEKRKRANGDFYEALLSFLDGIRQKKHKSLDKVSLKVKYLSSD